MPNSGFARCLTVSELSSYLKDILEKDKLLSNLWVKGEISNLKAASSRHIYFTLKDEHACVKSVIFRSVAEKMLFRLANGMKVMVRGYLSVYHKDGQYQLYVQEVHNVGLGDLHLAFEQLKAKLEEEGLFAVNLKQAIPVLPGKIGIVTSLTGAVIHDIITITRRRFPGLALVIAPAAVQGAEAPKEIAAAIERLNKYTDVDVIIVARGGGSLEELWAFNTEIVAKAIFASKIPVISAVGHETDFTIADLVADRRAPTPSAAAEIAVPDLRELQAKLKKLRAELEKGVSKLLNEYHLKLAYLSKTRVLTDPWAILSQYRQLVDYAERNLFFAVQNLKKEKKAEIAQIAGKLDALSPLAILQRGYAVCRKPGGQLITDVGQVAQGEQVEVILQNGSLQCMVADTVRSGCDE
ncbi:exodeoxyribonuclease VII large subunit [Zhaonella formicivorans]|uniref:exodeoxyribonuclease VII large subunit n=1 Tax=Zhaonella formicivorans TaxID=2528593 RepID=UPI0010D7B0F3|nr:exodeoxyribonuclease VII large subunit [Zhaonella formicivorans]